MISKDHRESSLLASRGADIPRLAGWNNACGGQFPSRFGNGEQMASGNIGQDQPPAYDGNMPADWTRAIVDPTAFAEEQGRLAHVWTFLGMTTDLANDGDWFRASIATRSVFVQRFGSELRGFENLCAHRRTGRDLAECRRRGPRGHTANGGNRK